MADATTKRAKLNELFVPGVQDTFIRIISEVVNRSIRGNKAEWILVREDPGYADTVSENPMYKNAHIGTHVVFNVSPVVSQNVHIDGIGLPFDDVSGDLCEFEGPLSVAVMLSDHRPTQIGEMYAIANSFFAVLNGTMSVDNFCAEVNGVLCRNKIQLDQERPFVKPVKPGTFVVFPKNMAVHRGLARGKSNVKPRAATYATFCRADKLDEYLHNKMETSELSPGFSQGFIDVDTCEMWFIQFLIALEVSCLFCFFIAFIFSN